MKNVLLMVLSIESKCLTDRLIRRRSRAPTLQKQGHRFESRLGWTMGYLGFLLSYCNLLHYNNNTLS